MIEICKMCGYNQTPWTYIKELDGHICNSCSELYQFLNNNFEIILKEILKYEQEYNEHYGIEHKYNKKAIKKGMLAVIRKWYKNVN